MNMSIMILTIFIETYSMHMILSYKDEVQSYVEHAESEN